MIGRKKTAAVCLLVLCFALTACGRAEPPEPRLVEYYGGVLNTAGQVIIPPPPKTEWHRQNNEVLTDRFGHSCYAMQTENHFQQAEFQTFGIEPNYEYPDGSRHYVDNAANWRSTGCAFRFYDSYGELVHTVDIMAEVAWPYDIQFCFAPDGDLQKSLFIIYTTEPDNQYQLYDYSGRLLTPSPLSLPNGSRKVLTLAPGFVALQYANSDGVCVDFYGWDGQPLTMAHEYFDFEQMNFYNLPQAEERFFYRARYTNEQGRRRYDILDAQGNVVLGNLIMVESHGTAGVFAATQGWGELLPGWLDLSSGRPQWLVEEPEPTVYYTDAADEKLIAAMQPEQEYEYIYRIYYEGRLKFYPSPYFAGRRCCANGTVLVDILDEKGSLLISGLKPWGLQYVGDGLFIAERGFERGLMNAQGEWLYQESGFKELED